MYKLLDFLFVLVIMVTVIAVCSLLAFGLLFQLPPGVLLLSTFLIAIGGGLYSFDVRGWRNKYTQDAIIERMHEQKERKKQKIIELHTGYRRSIGQHAASQAAAKLISELRTELIRRRPDISPSVFDRCISVIRRCKNTGELDMLTGMYAILVDCGHDVNEKLIAFLKSVE